jgi:unspecific monooxygenase
VLRAFTSRRIAALEPEIAALCDDLIDALPLGPFDLLRHFGQKLPVIVIARLLGVPEAMSDDLLRWSNAMVGMYMAGRTRETEDRAVAATQSFVAFLRGYVEDRRARPADDLITHLIAAEAEGERLTTEELITTCILLLNAGHEATVHSLGNGVKTLLETRTPPAALAPDRIAGTVEELLRFDPPLHLFTRHAYAPVEVLGHGFGRGDEIGLLLGAANRDPRAWEAPGRFDPKRPEKVNLAFGGGLHFCVGAPLARLELQIALPRLFARLPKLRLADPPRYADVFHFHGLERLIVRAD